MDLKSAWGGRMRGQVRLGPATVILALMSATNCADAAESVSYGEGVVGPRKHATDVRSLGLNLFGEEINTYTGGISFSQVDLSIPGNGTLLVAVTRRLNVDGNKSPSHQTDENLWRGEAFGEWEFDLPYLTGIYSELQGWVVNTSTPNARCSSPTSYDQFRPSDILLQGYVYFSSYNFWNGISLNLPAGQQKVLHRPAGGPIPIPTGTWTTLTTKDQWHFNCISNLKNGHAGEGFLGVAPDGTRYWFDWMASYAERPQKGAGYRIDSAGIRPQRIEAELNRRMYRLYPTRVEDRFGNHVIYAWSGTRLTSISANDGRSINVTYNTTGQIASVTDGTRTVQYGYSDGLLSSVTLPDGRIWTFTTASIVNLPRFVPLLQANSFDEPFTCQLMRTLAGDEADLSMTHPSGAQAIFRLGYNRLFRTNLSGSTGWCNDITGPDNAPRTWRDRQPLVPTRYDVLALKRKTLSGPGVTPLTWQFQHRDSYQLASPEGYPINGVRIVTATQPEGGQIVSVFGTDALTNEGHLLNEEIREGGAILSRTDNVYVQSSEVANVPFPDWMGQPLEYEYIRGRSDYNRPLKLRATSRQGRSFKWQVAATCGSGASLCFDVLARPTKLTKSSAPLP